jgi:hypothetical protein
MQEKVSSLNQAMKNDQFLNLPFINLYATGMLDTKIHIIPSHSQSVVQQNLRRIREAYKSLQGILSIIAVLTADTVSKSQRGVQVQVQGQGTKKRQNQHPRQVWRHNKPSPRYQMMRQFIGPDDDSKADFMKEAITAVCRRLHKALHTQPFLHENFNPDISIQQWIPSPLQRRKTVFASSTSAAASSGI